MAVAGPDLPVPPGFTRDVVRRVWHLPVPADRVWAWLCDPSTFTESQVPPWRVEFLDPDTGRPAGFREGVLTTHHGPLLHFSGVIAAMGPGRYRDLHYTYGAYAGSLRLARPVRLQFWVDDTSGRTELRLQVTTDVRRWLRPLWRLGNRLFWSRFATWATRSTSR